MNMKFLVCLCFAALLIEVRSTEISHCTIIDAPTPAIVDIRNCDKSPCTFYIGDSGVMSMKFQAPRYLEKFQPYAVATAMGANITYPLGENDGCVGVTNTPCPLARGEYVEYEYSMFILPIFPQISLTLEFALVDLDQDNKPFVCFKTDLMISKK